MIHQNLFPSAQQNGDILCKVLHPISSKHQFQFHLTIAHNCGITPTLEKLPFTSNGGADKKRPLSPDHSAIKRHKSVSDDTEIVKVEEKKKTFEDPAWE